MAYLNPDNTFQSWVMTPQELAQGAIFTITQKQYIQNQIANLAQEKLNLNYDSTNPILYAQRQAELHGQVLALQFLLSTSATMEKELAKPLTPDGE
jgi:hypothetical protein